MVVISIESHVKGLLFQPIVALQQTQNLYTLQATNNSDKGKKQRIKLDYS